MAAVVEHKVALDYNDAQHRPALVARIAEKHPGMHFWGIEDEVFTQEDGTQVRNAILLSPEKLAEHPYFQAQVWDTDPKSKAADIEVLAQREGKRLIEFGVGEALVAKLDYFTESIRDRFAKLLKCEPWEIGLAVLWKYDKELDTGVLSRVIINRAPKESVEQDKREKTWRDLSATLGGTWKITDDISAGKTTLDVFIDRISGKKFTFDEFHALFPTNTPAEDSWKKYPIAMSEDGSAIEYTLFHTLIIGQTGAGKGSALWAIIGGLIPAARLGLVEFYAIDPKNAEAKAAPNLFKEVATDADEWSDLLERLVADLKKRQANSGRSFEISEDVPVRILFIDELSALSTLDTDKKRAEVVKANLNIILSQGRSDGNIVIAAAQAPQKEMIGQARMFFGMRAALRTESASETDIVLGANATAEGAAAHEIEPANAGNGYHTSGIGYMRVEGYSKPVRIRFPFTTDEQLEEWDEEFRQLKISPGSIIKPDSRGRIVYPKPDQSVHNIWDNRFQPPALPLFEDLEYTPQTIPSPELFSEDD